MQEGSVLSLPPTSTLSLLPSEDGIAVGVAGSEGSAPRRFNDGARRTTGTSRGVDLARASAPDHEGCRGWHAVRPKERVPKWDVKPIVGVQYPDSGAHCGRCPARTTGARAESCRGADLGRAPVQSGHRGRCAARPTGALAELLSVSRSVMSLFQRLPQ